MFYNLSDNNQIPKSGLNFLTSLKVDKNFLLLCGFEKFRDFYVRVDILEKLFIKMIDNTKNRKFNINSDMINLIGCSTENFHKLMNFMNYKKTKDEKTYIYLGDNQKKRREVKSKSASNPFSKLLELNIK